MKIFSIDSPVYRSMVIMTEFLVLSICWFLGTLMGLGTTIGVSTVAACDVGMKIVKQEEGYVHRQFWKAYKSNLKQGIPLGLLNILAVYVVYLDFEFFNKTENASVFLLIAGMLSAVFFAACFVYAYPMTARYENTLPRILKNSFRICVRFYGRTFLLFLCLALELGVIFWNFRTMIFGLLFGPAALCLTVCLFAVPILNKLEAGAEEEKEKTE
ncbi:MAG: YesL family protein [Lachnospiraceae bacterium]|nr:YesL family protein [Lachnospiraceae bacterium]